ncbi:MAG: carboxypeptidase regulatory-like domain-containing protein [Acidobacteriaceae bacterium]|nr:carboxypeptidase regulatory-like domain-containing protein [Acidobacteriaceae bacterium]
MFLDLLAQTPDTATLHGQVVDQNQAAVAGAQITVTNRLTELRRTTSTDLSGNFWLPGLPIVGNYEIRANKQRFVEAHLDGLTLAGGTTADIKLELAVAGGETQITVTGAADEARTDSPQIGNRLGAKQIEATPLLNRKITYLPLLNAANRPAINQGDVFMNQNLFTTNGAGRRQTSFKVDGATGNDSWGRQTIFSNIPLAAVGEMTILVNEFSAEYGGSTGSAVNIITKSGSNQLHGEALGLWRPSATEAAL